MKKKGKAVVLIAVLLVGLTIGTGIAMDLPNKVTKEVVIESEDGQTRTMTWVAYTSLLSGRSSHVSSSLDGAIDTIGVEAYLYNDGEEIDSGYLMRHNRNNAWVRLYGSGDFAETYHTFIEGSESWYPYTCDS